MKIYIFIEKDEPIRLVAFINVITKVICGFSQQNDTLSQLGTSKNMSRPVKVFRCQFAHVTFAIFPS